ncbi:claudin-8-like [Scleropages formosus]|uniref:claudin-8-like n=1 Tax=Scleropages formosus TaxID=113540 RepID=UPI0008787ABE|nr:claudin-8-like [Scleropages formosus]
MVHGVLEIIALCLGLMGLIGACASTGMPMWKVTAFIGENIIVMETRWEGLWMNCYRQANIRMQCKVYDSLLYLPPDLQAARGLMCSAVALAVVGLLVALAGMPWVSWWQENKRAKNILLVVAGTTLCLSSLCVLIPVSWTGHNIIRDFYNPLLLNAQRRELGEALYIGWVTAGFLMVSGLMFVCRRVNEDSDSYAMVYPRPVRLIGYDQNTRGPAFIGYQPISSRTSNPIDRPLPELPTCARNQQNPRNVSIVLQPSTPRMASFMQAQPFQYNGNLVHRQPEAHDSNISTWRPTSEISSFHSSTPKHPASFVSDYTEPFLVPYGRHFQPPARNPFTVSYTSFVKPHSSINSAVSSAEEYI